jgi:hypothetical protein
MFLNLKDMLGDLIILQILDSDIKSVFRELYPYNPFNPLPEFKASI